MNFAEIWDAVTETGTNTGRSLRKQARDLRKYDMDDVLAAVNLERRRTTTDVMMPAVGFFAVGILAGVGLGMLFAPKPGYELREDLGEQVNKAMNRSRETGEPMSSVSSASRPGEENPVI